MILKGYRFGSKKKRLEFYIILKISRSEEITQVVTISANGDCKIGLDITEAIQRVG